MSEDSKQILRPGDRAPVTLHELAQRGELERPVPAGNVYPTLPSESPWSNPEAWGGAERSLGVNVNDMQPVGTAKEIEQSFRKVGSADDE